MLSVNASEIRDYCRKGNNILNAKVGFEVTGTPFTGTPDVAFTGGAGTGAAAHAVMENGSLKEIVIDEPGTGYTSAPTVTIGGVTSGGGSTATATASITGDAVTGVTLTDAGGQKLLFTDFTEYDDTLDVPETRAVVKFYIADKFGNVKEEQMETAAVDDQLEVSLGGMNPVEGISANVTVKSSLGNIKDGSVHDMVTIKQSGFFYIEA